MVDLLAPDGVTIDILGVCIFAGILLLTILAVVACYFKTQCSPAALDNPLCGAIRLAAAKGDIKNLQMLSFAPRFDVNAPLLKFTALHAAACGGQRDAALWLLQRGADVTATKEDGWNSTALHYAAAHGSIGVCEVLVAYEADVDAVDSFGFTPESLARKRRHAEVADYLASIKSKSATRPRPVELRGYDALLAPPVPEPWHNKFQNEKFNISVDLERGEKPPTGQDLLNVEEAAWKTAAARGEDGIGTEGTVPKEGLKVFRILAVCMQITNFGYLFYRAGWTFVPGATYGYSVFVFFMEYILFAFSFVFIFSMWNQIERPKRWISEMMSEEELPHVDIYIVRYNEPISLLEPTVVAALNINWPGDKLTVHILDDSQGKETMRMVKRLRFQLGVMKRKARLVSMTRRKLPGVPHHAKAGNITHAVLNSQGKGEFILVLDMDMIAHPDCLQRLLGHFYIKKEGKKGWERKPRTALIQTPQDFYNVPPGDPFVHSARFFYGPMMQGRDGIDSSPCCGTGAVFTRDSLVSVGGQSFGSITEDYNTSRTLFACGFTTMFLNERLSFGLAPEYIAEVFNQRQRWAMGALQMLFNPNSYGQYGLTYAQNLIFFEFLTYHFLAIPTVVMYIIPFIFIVFQIPPIQIANIWVFCVAFTTFFGKFQLSLSENDLGGFRFFCLNRAMLYWAHHSPDMDESAEMWRGWQMWLWLAPSHIKAIIQVMLAEGPLRWIGKCFGMKKITFVVTDKVTGPGAGRLGGTDGTGGRKKKKKNSKRKKEAAAAEEEVPACVFELFFRNLSVTWYFLVFYVVFIGTIGYTIYRVATNQLTAWMIAVYVVNLAWWGLAAWCLWPPVAALLPRVETETGWKIHWHAFLPRGKPIGVIETLDEEQGAGQGLQRKPSMAARLVKAVSEHLSVFGSRKLSQDPIKSAAQIERQASRAASHAVDLASYGNVGRLALPIRSATSLAQSALLTGAILPERDDHSFASSKRASTVLVLPDGRLAPVSSSHSAASSPTIQSGHPSLGRSSGGSPESLDRRASRLLAPSPFLNTQPSVHVKVLRAESLARRLKKLTGSPSMGDAVILPPGAETAAKTEVVEISDNIYDYNDSANSESVPLEIPLAVKDLPPHSKLDSSMKKTEDAIQEEEGEQHPEISFILPLSIPKKPAPRKGVSFQLPAGHKDDVEDSNFSAPSSPTSPTSTIFPKSKALKKKGVSFKLDPGADKGDGDDIDYAALPPGGGGSVQAPREEQQPPLPPPSNNLPCIQTNSDFDTISDQIVASISQEEEDYVRSLSPFAAEASTPFENTLTFENTGAGARSNVNTIETHRSMSVKPLHVASSRRVTSLSLAEKRARAASRYLLDWTPSVTGDGGASMLLSGGSMMVPIVPTTIFESSIAAKPSFEDRKKPLHSNSFLLASIAIELGMIIVGIVSSLVPHPLPT